jgi:hypothetical protein
VLAGGLVLTTPSLAAGSKQHGAATPRTPYPHALHPARTTLPRLHVHPNARSPHTPYPGALHPQTPILLPQGFTITVERIAGAPKPSDARSIGRPRDIAEQIADCWTPPAPGQGQTVEISLRLGFARSGHVIGPPSVTYVKAEPQERDEVRRSILAAVSGCAPLRFTPDHGSAIAGRPFAIRFVATRAQPAEPLTY